MTEVTLKSSRPARRRSQITFEGQGRTHQEFKQECEIQTIVDAWRRNGHSPHLAAGEPVYGDFSTSEDFHQAVQRIEQANARFNELPARVRTLCENDPGRLLSMLEDPQSVEMLEQAGLLWGVSPSKPKETPSSPESSSETVSDGEAAEETP